MCQIVHVYAYFQTIGIGCCIQSEMFYFSLIYVDTRFWERNKMFWIVHMYVNIFQDEKLHVNFNEKGRAVFFKENCLNGDIVCRYKGELLQYNAQKE